MSTAESTIADLHRNPLLDRQDVLKIVTEMQDLNIELEDDAQRRFLIYDGQPRARTLDTFHGNVIEGDKLYNPRDIKNWQFQRQLPDDVTTIKSYPLIHTTLGAGSFTFYPSPRNSFTSYQFGAYADNNGTKYITIDDNARLDPTTELTIAIMAYVPTGATSGIICEKTNQYELKINGSNFEFRVYSGSWKTPVTAAITFDAWNTIVCTYKSTASGQKIYKNGSLADSDAETGAMAGTANNLGIFATAAGGTVIPDGVVFAWFFLGSTEASSGWVTNYGNGLLNTDEVTEITTIPFVVSEDPQPDATLGGF